LKSTETSGGAVQQRCCSGFQQFRLVEEH